MSAERNKQLVMQGNQMFAKKDIQGILNMCTDEVEWSGEAENWNRSLAAAPFELGFNRSMQQVE